MLYKNHAKQITLPDQRQRYARIPRRQATRQRTTEKPECKSRDRHPRKTFCARLHQKVRRRQSEQGHRITGRGAREFQELKALQISAISLRQPSPQGGAPRYRPAHRGGKGRGALSLPRTPNPNAPLPSPRSAPPPLPYASPSVG